MATDGVSLFYNPDFVETLNAATLAGTLAHEVMHPALHHHVRRSGRDPKRWNVACDFAINPLLVDAGLSLPDGVLIDNRFRGMSAEQIYNLLESESETEHNSGNEGGDDEHGGEDSTEEESGDGDSNSPSAPITDGGIGQVLDAPLPDEGAPTIEEQAREWDVPVNQATTVARQAGKVPAGLNRTLEGAAEASVDWREMLRRLWSETTPADYSWMRPNRRHLWTGLYLPGVVREGVGEVAIAVDCSGSVSARQLRLFEEEARSILEGQRPERVYVLYFDAVGQKVETYEAGQRIDLNPVGGGGTEFGPCFEWLDERGIRPQALVFLTDLYGSFPPCAPAYPVLWASTGSQKAPFGEVIPMQAA
jgi:predicted metal-dependent peptidase